MSNIDNEELIDQFRNFLEKAGEDRKELPDKLDLFTFYREIIALKNEVKIESRLVKQGLDNFQKTAGLIEQGNQKIDALFDYTKTEQQKGPLPVDQSILNGLIDLYDRIDASLRTLPEARTKRSRFWFSRRNRNGEEIIRSIREGQQMILKRIADLLFDHGVQPIEVAEQKFDPRTMRAMGTDSITELNDGVVCKELRPGFKLNDEVIRLADVLVNRLMQK